MIVRYPDTIRTLTRSSADVPGPTEIGDDRDVLIFLGGDATFTETGGLIYALTSSSIPGGAATYAWSGAALGACAVIPTAPCVAAADVVRGTGPGTLAMSIGGASVATLVVSGGAPSRKLTLRVRR